MTDDYAERARREREASRARRRHFQEMDQNLRVSAEREVRLLLDEFFPSGAPEGLLERICRAQNRFIKDIVNLEKAVRDMHDGLHSIAEGAAQREVDGFNECARQVRAHAEELGVSEPVVNSLLRNQVARLEAEQHEKDRAATQQVEWKRA